MRSAGCRYTDRHLLVHKEELVCAPVISNRVSNDTGKPSSTFVIQWQLTHFAATRCSKISSDLKTASGLCLSRTYSIAFCFRFRLRMTVAAMVSGSLSGE